MFGRFKDPEKSIPIHKRTLTFDPDLLDPRIAEQFEEHRQGRLRRSKFDEISQQTDIDTKDLREKIAQRDGVPTQRRRKVGRGALSRRAS